VLCCAAVWAGKVLLLTNPIVGGYVQNPISVYYCFDDGGKLVKCIAEVCVGVWGRKDPAKLVLTGCHAIHWMPLPTLPAGTQSVSNGWGGVCQERATAVWVWTKPLAGFCHGLDDSAKLAKCIAAGVGGPL
jgi:hypothetical protein